MQVYKQIITSSLYVFSLEIQEAVQDGYSIDIEKSPPTIWGITYEVGMVKEVEDNPEQQEVSRKMSAAERMEKARAARKTK